MACFEVISRKLAVIKLENGEDVLEGLEREVRKMGISNGVILAGVGSTTAYHVHVAKSTGLPPGNVFFKGKNPFDIVSLQGYILNGRVHAHISLADADRSAQTGGHLEPGCTVLTFCAITVMETSPLGELDKYLIPGIPD